jgi:hypothetical protein
MPARPALPPTRTRQPREAPESFLLFLLVVCLMVTMASLFWAHNPAANIFAPITESQAQTTR